LKIQRNPSILIEKYSRLYGNLKLLHLKADHGWSNKSFKHLLDVLRDMLPEGNQLAESVYEAKKIICPLGIEVEKIHACKDNCVLFCGDYPDLDKFPKCGYDRYKRKKDGGDDMLMTRSSPARSEARRMRLTEGLL
jgi:hypothetical protein